MTSGYGFVPRGLSLFLSALLVATPVVNVSAADESGAPATAALAVASDPSGATVYVDGQFVGATPVSVERLSAGDHRVRIVKTGFLENGRIVRVTTGKKSTVDVKLTPSENAAAQVISSTGDGGSKKWLWIGLAAGGAAAAAVVLATRNHAPTAGTISASPSAALQGGTTVTFTSQGASDSDGDSLTYSWDFGDGTTGTGQTTSKVYSSSGTMNVTLTVSDGKKDATATTSFAVRSLTGTWRGTVVSFGTTTLSLTQTGTNVSGSYSDQFGLAGSAAGTVRTTPPQVTLIVTVPGFQPFTFTGSANNDVSGLNGVANGSGFINNGWTLTRQ
jgi:PKD domain-containing protein/PEGA domain-containing protein